MRAGERAAVGQSGAPAAPFAFPTLRCTAPGAGAPRRRHYVTSMATVMSAILFSAGLSSSWLSLREREREGEGLKPAAILQRAHRHRFIGAGPHLEPRSMAAAPGPLGICRLALADSFKAEGGGALPRLRGAWRPADAALRQTLFPPMRT